MERFGKQFIYTGGSFLLTKKTLPRAIKITEASLKRDRKALSRWHRNPNHPDFKYDMEHFGPRIIDNLLMAHVRFELRVLEQLQSLKIGSQMLLEFAE